MKNKMFKDNLNDFNLTTKFVYFYVFLLSTKKLVSYDYYRPTHTNTLILIMIWEIHSQLYTKQYNLEILLTFI